jgi:hypothetical protein
VTSQGREAAYLEEVKATRNRPHGPCVATYNFLKEKGKEAVPTVLKAIELYSGPADASVRAQIVNGAWYYDRAATGGDVLLPIMSRASGDPDATVSKKAREWLQARQKAKAAE